MDENKLFSQDDLEKTIKNRIGLLIERKGLNRKSFAERINENPSKLSHIFTGRNNPSLDLIQKILKSFPDVSADWLIRGEGQEVGSFLKSAQMDNLPDNRLNAQSNNLPNNQPVSEAKIDNTDIPPVQPTHKKTMDKVSGRAFQSNASTKKIQKIVILYDDGSFEER